MNRNVTPRSRSWLTRFINVSISLDTSCAVGSSRMTNREP
jgi:hypothetical protein